MQPSSLTRATIVSAENQNGATIVKATFFFCHYYIVWESYNTGEAQGQSWNESIKSRWIPGGSCGYTSGTKRKHFAALSAPWPCWRWLQLQPSCGSPQCIGSDNGLSPDRCRVIIWTNVGIMLIWILGTNFNDILSKIQTFFFKKMHLKMLSGKCCPFCLGLNELTQDCSNSIANVENHWTC